MKLIKYITLAIVSVLMASCAQQSFTGDTYSRSEAQRSQAVKVGTVSSVKFVTLQGNTSTGSLLGGAAGGLLGYQVGGGKTANTIGAVAGAALGSAAGSHLSNNMTQKQGIEVTVKLDSGRYISVVQEHSPRQKFYKGSRVKVLSNGHKTRVSLM